MEKINNTYISGNIVGEWHDASICTFDGRKHYVASLCIGSHILDVFEDSDSNKCKEWVLSQLLLRTGKAPERFYKNNG